MKNIFILNDGTQTIIENLLLRPTLEDGYCWKFDLVLVGGEMCRVWKQIIRKNSF